MADELYLERDAKSYGPYSTAHVLKLAAAGRLQRTDLVRKEGMAKGVPAAQVKQLFPHVVAGAAAASTNVPAIQNAPSPDVSRVPLPEEDSGPELEPSDMSEAAPEPAREIVPDALMLVSITEEADPEASADPAAKTPRVQTAAAGGTSHDKPIAKQNPPVLKTEPAKKLRAFAVSGAVITSQDGTTVRYKRKCSQCGFEDANGASMSIKRGTMSVSFFCPKCRKSRGVQIRGQIY